MHLPRWWSLALVTLWACAGGTPPAGPIDHTFKGSSDTCIPRAFDLAWSAGATATAAYQIRNAATVGSSCLVELAISPSLTGETTLSQLLRVGAGSLGSGTFDLDAEGAAPGAYALYLCAREDGGSTHCLTGSLTVLEAGSDGNRSAAFWQADLAGLGARWE
jgi:hypothetical protein